MELKITNPFPGPQPYSLKYRAYFCGRHDEAQRLTDSILAHRCLTLYGPSSAGKSSLLQAAVIPGLEEQYDVRHVAVDQWPAGSEGAEAEHLLSALYKNLELGPQPPGDARERLEIAMSLAERRSDQPILIVLDQLEQLLFPDRSPALCERFFAFLEGFLSMRVGDLHIVLALREDYFGLFRDRARACRRLLSTGFRLGPFTVKQMVPTVIEAASAGGQDWEASPGRDRIQDVIMQLRVQGQSASGDAEVESVHVQIACHELFDARTAGTSAAWSGPINTEDIFRTYFDRTLASVAEEDPARDEGKRPDEPLTDEQRAEKKRQAEELRAAADKFLEALVGENHLRRILKSSEVDSVLPDADLRARVLKKLQEKAIVRSGAHSGDTWYELGHDWLAKRVSELRKERRIAEEERLKAEEARKALEKADQERFEKEEKRRAENRWLRTVIAVVAVAGVVAIGLAGIAVYYGQDAERSKTKAQREKRNAEEATERANHERESAQMLKVITRAREYLQLNQPGLAAELLLRVERPDEAETQEFGWRAAALETLGSQPPVGTFKGRSTITVVSLDPGGTKFVLVTDDGKAALWTTARRLLGTIDGPPCPEEKTTADETKAKVDAKTKVDEKSKEDTSNGKESSSTKPVPRCPAISVAWSAEGSRLALVYSASIQVVDVEKAAVSSEIKRSSEPILAAAFDEKGAIVHVETDGAVWKDQADKHELLRPKEKAPLRMASFGARATRLFVMSAKDAERGFAAEVWKLGGNDRGAIKLADPGVAGVEAAMIYGRRIRSVDFDTLGERLVVVVNSEFMTVNNVLLYSVEAPTKPVLLETCATPVRAVFGARDIRVVCSQELVVSHSIQDPRYPRSTQSFHATNVANAALASLGPERGSPDEQTLLTAQRSLASLWKQSNPREQVTLPLRDGRVQWGHDGRRLLVGFGSRNAPARLVDLGAVGRPAVGELLPRVIWEKVSASSNDISPDGTQIAVGFFDGALSIWGANELDKPRESSKIKSKISQLEFSPDSKYLAVLGKNEREVRVWRSSGTTEPRFFGSAPIVLEEKTGESIESFVFSADSRHMITRSTEGTLRLWDLLDASTSSAQAPLKGTEAMFSADGRYLITRVDEKKIMISRPGEPALCDALEHSSDLSKARLNVAGNRWLTIDKSTVKIWAFDEGAPPHCKELIGPSPEIDDIVDAQFGFAGQYVAILHGKSSAASLRIWDLKEKSYLPEQRSNILRMAFGPDSNYMLTASADSLLRIWWLGADKSLQLGDVLRADPFRSLSNVFFAPDGKNILYFGNRVVRRWSTFELLSKDSSEVQRRLKAIPKECLPARDRVLYLGAVPKEAAAAFKQCQPGMDEPDEPSQAPDAPH